MQKTILILGAGFGGLHAAYTLARKNRWLSRHGYRIVLVDQNTYHTFTPLLYEVATTHPDSADAQTLRSLVTYDIKQELLPSSVTYIHGTVTDIQTDTQTVYLGDTSLSYAYLVIALGSVPHFFNIPGLNTYAHTLKSVNDALKIRDTLSAYAVTKQNIRVVIGGGGPTGVELAGEIMTWATHFPNTSFHTTLLESSPHILKPFPQTVQKKALKRLTSLGVSVITNTPITRVTQDDVHTPDQTYAYDICIWTGGVRPHPLTQVITKQDGMKRIPVSEDLRYKQDIFIIGDMSEAPGPVPDTAVARSAIEQGKRVAKNIMADIRKQPLTPYVCKQWPYIIPVGGKYAIATWKTMTLAGFVAWIIKGIVEFNYLASILSIPKAFTRWMRGLLLFLKNDRLG